MTTATISEISKPASAARYEVFFKRMQRSRELYAESDKFHLQMTLWCNCEKCHRHEREILTSFERKGIPYTVEVMKGGDPNERYVCFQRKGEDIVRQVSEQTGFEVGRTRAYPSIEQENREFRNALLRRVAIIVAIIALVVGIWVYNVYF